MCRLVTNEHSGQQTLVNDGAGDCAEQSGCALGGACTMQAECGMARCNAALVSAERVWRCADACTDLSWGSPA